MAAKKAARPSSAITLHDHIKELRNRFFGVAIIFVVVSAVAYNYKDTLLYYLLKPLNGEKLVYLNPAGGFSFIFQVTMYVGLAAAIPFLVYNLYKFVAPALPESARKHSAAVMISSLLLLVAGVAFGYIYAIPGALNFLNTFGDGYITPNLTADSYLNFILAYTAGLGILFQLPLVLLLIHWIHPLKPMGLFKFERYMILIAFVGAAMITPTPDVMNQTVMALPIIVMYQVGVIAVCVSVYRVKRKARPARLSKAQRKAQQRARRNGANQAPRREPTMPEIPQALAISEVIHPTTPVAPITAQRTHKPQYRPDIIRPGKQSAVKSVTTPAVQATASVVVPVSAPPSQTRKSMDIMIATTAAQPSQRGTIPRTDRLMYQRQPSLQVPHRQRNIANSVDGISLVS